MKTQNNSACVPRVWWSCHASSKLMTRLLLMMALGRQEARRAAGQRLKRAARGAEVDELRRGEGASKRANSKDKAGSGRQGGETFQKDGVEEREEAKGKAGDAQNHARQAKNSKRGTAKTRKQRKGEVRATDVRLKERQEGACERRVQERKA